MSKKLLLMGLGYCCALMSGFAQEQSKTKWLLELQPVISFEKGADPDLNLAFGVKHRVSDYIALGGMLGVTEKITFKGSPAIPVVGRLNVEKQQEQNTPFVDLDLGYALNTSDMDYNSIIINPTIGYRLGRFYGGVGYYGTVMTKGGSGISSAVNIRLGYNLGGISKDSGAGRFFSSVGGFLRRTYFSLEAGYGKSIGSVDGLYDSGKIKDVGDNWFVNLTWNYDIDKHWTAGLGFSYRNYFNPHNRDIDAEIKRNVFGGFIRGQYTLLDEAVMFRPFIGCNVGVRPSSYETGFEDSKAEVFVEPQVGVKYSRYKLAVGYSHRTLKLASDGYKNSDMSSIYLSLGVDLH